MGVEPRVSTIGLRCECCGKRSIVLHKDGCGLVCSSCGHVVSATNIEEGPEWRSFEGGGDSRVRVGTPLNHRMQDKGLSTLVGLANEGSTGIVGRARGDLKRLRKWQQKLSGFDSKERSLSHALIELTRVGERLNISNHVLNEASHIFRIVLERKLVRGISISVMAAASLCIALRQEGVSRNLTELSSAWDLEPKKISRIYRLLTRQLRIKIPVVDPLNHVRKICGRAGLSKKVMLEAEKIVRLAQRKKLTIGKSPIGTASAAVYYACVLMDAEKTQQEIAVAANITEVTLRNRYKNLNDHLEYAPPTHRIDST